MVRSKKAPPVQDEIKYRGKVDRTVLYEIESKLKAEYVNKPTAKLGREAWQWLVEHDEEFKQSLRFLNDPEKGPYCYPVNTVRIYCDHGREKHDTGNGKSTRAYIDVDMPNVYASYGRIPAIDDEIFSASAEKIRKASKTCRDLIDALGRKYLARSKSEMFAAFPELKAFYLEVAPETSVGKRGNLPLPVATINSIEKELCALVNCIGG